MNNVIKKIDKNEAMEHELPLVSILVVTYNQAHLVKETLDSILSQDYSPLQIVVADDASTDDTGKIIADYAEKFPKVVVAILNEKNIGITGNCNRALSACAGEFVAITGGDDLFLPGKITMQVQAFIDDPEVVLSYHPVEIFESTSGRTLYTTNRNQREDTNNALEIISKAGIPGASSVMVRRAACPPWGFEPSLETVSDWIFFIEVAMRGKVAKIDQVLGRYRKHLGGASNRTFDLLGESLQTLEIVQARYVGTPGLEQACREGKSRYLAGEALRQVSKSPSTARDLITQALEPCPWDIRYRLIQIATYLGPLGRWFGVIINRLKYSIKSRFI